VANMSIIVGYGQG